VKEKSELIHANITVPAINFFSTISPETFQQPVGRPGGVDERDEPIRPEESLDHK
jgi:hypothetical protein